MGSAAVAIGAMGYLKACKGVGGSKTVLLKYKGSLDSTGFDALWGLYSNNLGDYMGLQNWYLTKVGRILRI